MAAPSTAHAAASRVLMLCALSAFAASSSVRVCDPMLPELSRQFGVTMGEASHVVTWYVMAYGVLQFFYGPLGDRYGKYRMVTAATLLCAAGSLGAAFSASLDSLIAWRMVTGAFSAGIVPLSMAWIGDHVEYEQRQATLARFLTGVILGVAAGQLYGGFFTDTLGWRWAFVFLALVFLTAGALMYLRRPSEPSAAKAPRGAGMLGPMRQVVRVRWARVVLVTVMLEGALVFGVLSFVPAYLQQRYGLAPTAAGAVVAVYALGGLVYVAVARRLLSGIGERGLAATGGVVLAAAFLAYWLGPGWGWSVAASLAVGFGYYLLHNTLQTHATQMTPQVRGTAVSLFASFLFLGQAAGVAMVGLAVDEAGLEGVFAAVAVALPALSFAFVHALGRRAAAAREAGPG